MFVVTIVGGNGGLSQNLVNAARDVTQAAADFWARYIDFSGVTIEIALDFQNLGAGILAQAGPTFFSDGDTFNGLTLFEAGPLREIRTGIDPDGADPDIEITLNSVFLADGTFFLGDFSNGAFPAVPAGRDDLFDTQLHEIGHGLGFLSFIADMDGTASDIDVFITQTGGNFFFTGPNAVAEFGGNVPLDIEPSHLNSSTGLLLAPSSASGTRLLLSPLEIAIFDDFGLPIREATNGNDNLFGFFLVDDTQALLGGNDQYRAESGNDTVSGGDGNDTLFGGEGDDLLGGGNDNDVVLGGAGQDTLAGGEGADQLLGQAGADDLFGGNGNDTITGGDGADLLVGNADFDFLGGGGGDDTLLGGADGDTLAGGDDNDRVSGNQGADQLFGGNGSDTVDGGDGADFLTGFNGDDIVSGNLGNDTVFGGLGNDTVVGGNGADFVAGNAGNDELFGGIDNDTLDAGLDNDLAAGGDGDDTISGNIGDDTVFGGNGADVIVGGNGNDSLFGNIGADQLFGGEGADTINAGDGADLVAGNAGNDLVFGGNGADTLNGGDGADDLRGGNSNDQLFGTGGNDILTGGEGNDTLNGGNGNDTFVFAAAVVTGVDQIAGFVAGGGDDVIALNGFGPAFDNFTDVQAAATDDGTDTTIDLGDGDSIVLLGVVVTQLAASDFIFGYGIFG